MKRIGIFWDYENCKLPDGKTGYTVAGNIRRAAERLGDEISVFKAYLDIYLEDSTSKRSQAELQASGVSLIHCPHLNRKEVADRVLVVDFLVFALESKEPVTLILITGDRDFTYALSALQMKGHDVYVIHPPWYATYHGYKHLATGFLAWKELCSGERFTFTPSDKAPDSRRFSGQRPPIEQATRSNMESNLQMSSSFQRPADRSYRPQPGGSLPTPQPSSYSLRPAQLNAVSGKKPMDHSKPLDQGKPFTDRFALVDTSNSLDNPNKFTNHQFPKGPPGHSLKAEGSQPPANKPTVAPSMNNDVSLSSYSDMEISSSPRRSESPDSIVEISASTFITGVMTSNSAKRTAREGSLLATSSFSNNNKRTKYEARFNELIKVLREGEERGLTSLPCDAIDNRLRSINPNIYLEQGVTEVRAYLRQAEQAHVVFFTDIEWNGCNGWVALRSAKSMTDSGTGTTSNDTIDAATGLMKKLKVSSRRRKKKKVKKTYLDLVRALREHRAKGKLTLSKDEIRGVLRSIMGKNSVKGKKLLAHLNKAHREGVLIVQPEGEGANIQLHPDHY